MGHSKRKQLDPSDNETSRELESDDMPKSCWIKEEIQRVVREELKPVKSDLEEAKRYLKLLISHLTHIFGSHIADNVKGKKVVKDDDTIQGEVREESEHSSSQSVRSSRSSGKRRKRDEERKLQLRFKESLPTIVYTDKKLAIHVELFDANTGHIVESGPESFVEVKVVVLEGDSGTVGNGEKSLARGDPGKGSLLFGLDKVNLKEGSGLLNVQFTQVSKWSRGKKFILAVLPEGREYIDGVTSEPISVKAGRGEANEKHYPPQPNDEVWRLVKIGKNGPFHTKLGAAGIRYVREFVQLLNTDEEKLRTILGERMTNNTWNSLKAHAEQCRLNETRDADKFSPEQENHEDTIGKASCSFQYQVSENPAPARHNVAPSTYAAPVGPEAPPANVGSIAEGHNELAGLQSSIGFQDTMKDPANEARPPRQPTWVYPARDLVSPFNCQATMPSHAIDSSSRMGYTSNENFPPPLSLRASMSSFPNGDNDVTALPSSVQSQNTNFENPMKSPANGSARLALRQPTPTGCSSAPFSIGENAITTTVSQFQGFPPQPTVPSHVIGSPSPMDYTCDGNVPPYGPRHDSSSSFLYGPLISAERLKGPTFLEDNRNTTFESPASYPYENVPDPARMQSFNFYTESGIPDLDFLLEPYCHFPLEDDHVMEDLPSKFAADQMNSADLQNIDTSFPTSPRYHGLFQAPE